MKKLSENEWYGVAVAMMVIGVIFTLFGIWMGKITCGM